MRYISRRSSFPSQPAVTLDRDQCRNVRAKLWKKSPSSGSLKATFIISDPGTVRPKTSPLVWKCQYLTIQSMNPFKMDKNSNMDIQWIYDPICLAQLPSSRIWRFFLNSSMSFPPSFLKYWSFKKSHLTSIGRAIDRDTDRPLQLSNTKTRRDPNSRRSWNAINWSSCQSRIWTKKCSNM